MDLERVVLHRSHAIEGALIVAVDHSKRKWRELHNGYTICTILPEQLGPESGGEMRYRKWRNVRLEPGTILLMEPAEVHVTTSVVGLASFRLLQLTPDVVERAARELDLACAVHWKAPSWRDPQLFAAFSRLHSLVEQGFPLEQQEAQFVRCLRSLLLACGEDRPRVPPGSRREVKLVKDYIHAHWQRRISLEELARACDLTRFRVDQLFASELGIAPLQYQLELRINAARARLTQGQRVVDVANELGFYDHAQFSRLFKRALGVSPRAYVRATRDHARPES